MLIKTRSGATCAGCSTRNSIVCPRSIGPLILCYLEGRTYTETAKMLGWADGTVSRRRARELLRRRLTLWWTHALHGDADGNMPRNFGCTCCFRGRRGSNGTSISSEPIDGRGHFDGSRRIVARPGSIPWREQSENGSCGSDSVLRLCRQCGLGYPTGGEGQLRSRKTSSRKWLRMSRTLG